MILTCHDCPRKLAFCGIGAAARRRYAGLFGWLERAGHFVCPTCGGER